MFHYLKILPKSYTRFRNFLEVSLSEVQACCNVTPVLPVRTKSLCKVIAFCSFLLLLVLVVFTHVLGCKTCKTRSGGLEASIAITPTAEVTLNRGRAKNSGLFGKKYVDLVLNLTALFLLHRLFHFIM